MPGLSRRLRWLLILLALLPAGTGALAQTGPVPSPLLAPPTLPSVLPSGTPLPGLPPGQQDAPLAERSGLI